MRLREQLPLTFLHATKQLLMHRIRDTMGPMEKTTYVPLKLHGFDSKNIHFNFEAQEIVVCRPTVILPQHIEKPVGDSLAISS